jgi:hypothetical protein
LVGLIVCCKLVRKNVCFGEMIQGKVSTATGLSGHEILKMYEVAKKNGKTTERKIDGQLSTKRDYISNNYLANTVIEE